MTKVAKVFKSGNSQAVVCRRSFALAMVKLKFHEREKRSFFAHIRKAIVVGVR